MSQRIVRRMVAAGLAVVALAFTARAEATSPATLQEAQTLAAERGVPVLIDFYAVWCGPCKRFTKDATEQADVKAALEKVVLFKVDAEKGDGIPLAAKHGVVGFPTFELVNAQGASIGRWIGYDREQFLQMLNAALADPTPIEAKLARFEKNPTAADAVTLANVHSSRGEVVETVGYLRKAQELDPAQDHRMDIFASVVEGVPEKFTKKDAIAAADDVFGFEKHTPQQALWVATSMTALGRKLEDPKLAVPYLKAAVKETENSDDERVQAQRTALLVDHALVVEKNPDLALRYRRDGMPAGWMEDAGQLNEFAWWCFENKVNLEEAETLARKGVELAAAGSEKAMILDTLAEICNARGTCKDAVTYIELAIKEAPGNDYYKKQLERFQKILAEKGS